MQVEMEMMLNALHAGRRGVTHCCDVTAVPVIALYRLWIIRIYFIQPHMRIPSSCQQVLVSCDLKFVNLHLATSLCKLSQDKGSKGFSIVLSDILGHECYVSAERQCLRCKSGRMFLSSFGVSYTRTVRTCFVLWGVAKGNVRRRLCNSK